MRVFAAVDIGSNSVRIKIARVIRHRLETIHEDRVVTRLGESVFRFGTLSPEAMEDTVKVLRRFYREVQDFGVDQVRVVATSALRDARNSAAFIAWVHSATGWKVETISGLEEGRLIHLGSPCKHLAWRLPRSPDRPRRRQLRVYAFGKRAHSGDGQSALGSGAPDRRIPAP